MKRAQMHDCFKDPEGCDVVHPNIIAKPCIARSSISYRSQEIHPPKWREWFLKPKVVLQYFNQHTLRAEIFNLSEAFAQMSTNGKLNIVHNILENCLDDEERSMLYSDISEKKAT